MQTAEKLPPGKKTELPVGVLLPTDKSPDPVCAMSVEPSHAAGSAEHEGRTYYFCSNSCRQKFQADPKRYLKPHAPESGVMSNSRPLSARSQGEATCLGVSHHTAVAEISQPVREPSPFVADNSTALLGEDEDVNSNGLSLTACEQKFAGTY